MPGLSTSRPRRGTGRAREASGLRALGEAVDRLTAPLIGSQRLLAADLALAWATIAGDRLAGVTHPDRLVFPPKRRSEGTLHLRAASGPAALELQHETRRLIDRINAHLGYAAVDRLKVVQAPLPPRPAASGGLRVAEPSPPSDAPDESRTEPIDAEEPAGIEDERLRGALARLGRRVLAEQRKARRSASVGDACPDDGKPV